MKRERGLVFLVPEGRFSGGQEGDSWWDENKYEYSVAAKPSVRKNGNHLSG